MAKKIKITVTKRIQTETKYKLNTAPFCSPSAAMLKT